MATSGPDGVITTSRVVDSGVGHGCSAPSKKSIPVRPGRAGDEGCDVAWHAIRVDTSKARVAGPHNRTLHEHCSARTAWQPAGEESKPLERLAAAREASLLEHLWGAARSRPDVRRPLQAQAGKRGIVDGG